MLSIIIFCKDNASRIWWNLCLIVSLRDRSKISLKLLKRHIFHKWHNFEAPKIVSLREIQLFIIDFELNDVKVRLPHRRSQRSLIKYIEYWSLPKYCTSPHKILPEFCHKILSSKWTKLLFTDTYCQNMLTF